MKSCGNRFVRWHDYQFLYLHGTIQAVILDKLPRKWKLDYALGVWRCLGFEWLGFHGFGLGFSVRGLAWGLAIFWEGFTVLHSVQVMVRTRLMYNWWRLQLHKLTAHHWKCCSNFDFDLSKHRDGIMPNQTATIYALWSRELYMEIYGAWGYPS